MQNIHKTGSFRTFDKQDEVDSFAYGARCNLAAAISCLSGCDLFTILTLRVVVAYFQHSCCHTHKKKGEIKRLMLLEQSEAAGRLQALTLCCFKSAELKSLQR